jgi:hypothetical protein
MKSYDIPTYENLSPEAARKALNKLRADILADREHPYNDALHTQHEDAVRVFRDLNAMIRAGDEDAASAAKIADLEDALGEDIDLSPPECLARARKLMRIPGYLTPEPGAPKMPEGAREKLRRKIHALHEYAARVEGEERANAEAERASAEALEADGGADADAGDGDDAYY